MIKFKHNQPGFSLVETIVVLMVVAVGLVGIINLTLQSLRAQTLNRNTLVAYQLAQEGLELIRNVRDTNWLENSTTTPVAWNRYLEGTPMGAKYRVDYLHFQPVPVADISEARLQLASSSDQFFYLHDETSSNSIFSRLITITADGPTAPSSTVSCLVKWTDQGDDHQFNLETELYDWK